MRQKESKSIVKFTTLSKHHRGPSSLMVYWRLLVTLLYWFLKTMRK